MDSYPIGLHARLGYFRVVKHVWDNPEVPDFVLSRMKASANNIKPVIIIDEKTKTCVCKIPNTELTDFEDTLKSLDTMILCKRVEGDAEWIINRTEVQECPVITVEERDKICECLEDRDHLHKKLKPEDEKFVNSKLKEIRSRK